MAEEAARTAAAAAGMVLTRAGSGAQGGGSGSASRTMSGRSSLMGDSDADDVFEDAADEWVLTGGDSRSSSERER